MSIIRKWKRRYLYPGLLKANQMIKTNPKPKSKPHRKKGQPRDKPVSPARIQGRPSRLVGGQATEEAEEESEARTGKRKARLIMSRACFFCADIQMPFILSGSISCA